MAILADLITIEQWNALQMLASSPTMPEATAYVYYAIVDWHILHIQFERASERCITMQVHGIPGKTAHYKLEKRGEWPYSESASLSPRALVRNVYGQYLQNEQGKLRIGDIAGLR